MAKAECKKVIGSDEYGREAWLMVSQHKDSDNIEILSSEEGSPVVYTKSQISELIKELKKIVKICRRVVLMVACRSPKPKTGVRLTPCLFGNVRESMG